MYIINYKIYNHVYKIIYKLTSITEIYKKYIYYKIKNTNILFN